MSNDVKANGFYRFVEPTRAVFLHAVKPYVSKDTTIAPSYNATMLIVPGSKDYLGLRAIMGEVASAKWPGRDLSTIQFPVQLGEEKAEEAVAKKRDGSIFLGHLVFNAHTSVDYPPRLGVLENGKLIQLDTEILKAQYGSKFYHGCYIAPQVNLVAWDQKGKNAPDRVTAYLQMVLWIKDGTRIGGADMAEVFKDYMGQFTPEVDPRGMTGQRSKEVPF